MGYIDSHLGFLKSVDEGSVHYVACFILDRQFAQLQLLRRYADLNNIDNISTTVQEYTKLLLKMIQSCASWSITADRNANDTSVPQQFTLFGDSLTSFGEVEMFEAKAELSRYQKLTLLYKKGTSVLSWMHEHESSCPNVVRFARCLFSIPRSQAENERIFSIAGIIYKHRRSRISVEQL